MSLAATSYTDGKVRQTGKHEKHIVSREPQKQKPILSMKKGWAHVAVAYGAWDNRRPFKTLNLLSENSLIPRSQ